MKHHKRKEFTFPAAILLGAGFALCAVAATAFLLAAVAYFTNDPTAMTGAFSLLSLLIAGAVSGFVTSRVNGEGGSLIGAVSAIVAATLMLAIGLVWERGLLPIGVVLNLIVFIIASSASSLLGKKRKKHKVRF